MWRRGNFLLSTRKPYLAWFGNRLRGTPVEARGELRLAEGAAMDTGSSLPLGTLAASIYSLFCGAGDGDLDYSGVIRMIEGVETPAAVP